MKLFIAQELYDKFLDFLLTGMNSPVPQPRKVVYEFFYPFIQLDSGKISFVIDNSHIRNCSRSDGVICNFRSLFKGIVLFFSNSNDLLHEDFIILLFKDVVIKFNTFLTCLKVDFSEFFDKV